MADSNDSKSTGLQSVLDELPLDKLKGELQDVFKAMGEKTMDSLSQRISDATNSLTDIADNGGFAGKVAKGAGTAAVKGESPVKGALKGGVSGVKDKVKSALPGGGGGNKATKSTNIIEEIDVGVPIDVAYNQWTQFQEFSGFMKKVHHVEQEEDTKVNFKAQVFWSHRTWEATILEQVPNERIVWRSKGEKGHVDGAVTFHELGPNLTRILVVLEYYPQGFMERTGNIWRAQGRRARLELKHFRRHVMTRTILEPEEVEGWRGEIREGEVVRSHEEVVEEEQAEDQYEDEGPEEGAEDEYDEEAPEDEYDEEAPEDEYEEEAPEYEEEEYDEEAPEEEYEEEAPEDEYEEAADEEPADEYEEEEEPEYEEEREEEPADEYDEDVDEYEEEEEEPEEQPRRRRSGSRTSSRKRG
jgi:uncharacterized membrane protein